MWTEREQLQVVAVVLEAPASQGLWQDETTHQIIPLHVMATTDVIV